MDKKNKQNLFVTVIFTLIVSITLFYMYDNFKFQTYGNVVYYDYILNGENDNLKVENIEAYYNQDSFILGDGEISFKSTNIVEADSKPIVKVILKNGKQEFEYETELINYTRDNLTHSIEKIKKNNKKINLNDIEIAQLQVTINDKVVDKLNLEITPVEQLEGSNKEYRIENASISKKMMRLGNLKIADKEIVEKYPNISLEYRYLKDPKKSRADNDNYIVFKKITGESKKLVNTTDYGTYYLDKGNFKNKELSVVIIFSNNSDKFVFAIDLTPRQVGDYYG